jgi:hypothetical protein
MMHEGGKGDAGSCDVSKSCTGAKFDLAYGGGCGASGNVYGDGGAD